MQFIKQLYLNNFYFLEVRLILSLHIIFLALKSYLFLEILEFLKFIQYILVRFKKAKINKNS